MVDCKSPLVRESKRNGIFRRHWDVHDCISGARVGIVLLFWVKICKGTFKVLGYSGILGAFAELQEVTISFVMSVCVSFRPHWATRLSLDGFSWNFIFRYFSKNLSRIFNFELTLILLTWRIWWAPNNASRWQVGFKSAFKGLKSDKTSGHFTWSCMYIYDYISQNYS